MSDILSKNCPPRIEMLFKKEDLGFLVKMRTRCGVSATFLIRKAVFYIHYRELMCFIAQIRRPDSLRKK